jgi:hypothetical protein
MSFMAERTTYPAPGLAGGRAGGRGDVRLNGKRIDNRKQYLLKPAPRCRGSWNKSSETS